MITITPKEREAPKQTKTRYVPECNNTTNKIGKSVSPHLISDYLRNGTHTHTHTHTAYRNKIL